MSPILESIMLICFGFSWPINVIKGYKARTAKSMSLPFILLIISGYIAGITAKLVSQQINFVLIVYLLNLAIVSLNLVIYFRNRKLDKIQETVLKDELESDHVDSEHVASDHVAYHRHFHKHNDSKHSVAY
ncbi:hypothetical protein AALB81_02510 [Lachnospiraceae bacterium 48-33]